MNKIRELAKKIENQNLFLTCKEISSLKLFNNDKDLTKLQHIYLNYLFYYSNLNMDIALHKINKIILTDEIYEDAYTYYKQNRKQDETKSSENKQIHLVFPKKNKKRNK